MGCIYLVTHIESGRGYVGQSCCDDPAARWKRHQRDARRGSQLYFHRAIRLYGADAFRLEVLFVARQQALNPLEKFFAQELETYAWDTPGGYNSCWCGATPRMLGLKHTPEARQKIREANMRRWALYRAAKKPLAI